MQEFMIEPALLSQADGQTVIVTGAANGIGAATATLFNHHGANVILSDLASLEGTAAALIQTFSWPEKAAFVAADVLDWEQMKTLFHETVRIFGEVNIVIANAGVMESHPVLDLDNVDENGDLIESTEGFRVIDINLKGTLNSRSLRSPHHVIPY